MLPDVMEIFITAQFVINSGYIISDCYDGPTGLDQYSGI